MGICASTIAMACGAPESAAAADHAHPRERRGFSGVVDVRDFGAKGDGATDDTAALQAAIDSVGVFRFKVGNIRSPESYGGGRILLPPGHYLSGPIFVPGAIELAGFGLSTHVDFRGSPGQHWLQRNPKETTKGITTEGVAVRDMLITSSDFSGDAIHLVAVEKIRLSNLTIAGFKNGIYITNAGFPAGESYYHTLDGVDAHDNVVNLYADTGASVLTCNGCYFWHTNSFARADYTVILKSSGVVFNGGSIEGRPNIAQVYDQADSVTYNLGYSETRAYNAMGFKPFIKKKIVSGGAATGGSLVNLPPGFGLLFEGFDLTRSDAVQITTQPRFPPIALASRPIFIPAIPNGNMRHGATGWTCDPTRCAGRVEYDPRDSFNSTGSMKLIHDGSGRPLEMVVPIEREQTAQYVGRRVWITAVVKHSESAQQEQLYAFGAGNTNTKVSSKFPVVDYGNGWRLYAVDVPVITGEPLSARIRFTSSAPGDSMLVTNPQIFMDGFDLIPASRDVAFSPPRVSPDRGDASVVLVPGLDAPVQRWATKLSAKRQVTCSTENARAGDTFRIVRTDRSPYSISVCGVTEIQGGTDAFVDVTFDGTAWVPTGGGAF